jgi:Na+/proline symporter
LTNYGWGILGYIALIFIAGVAVMPLVMKSGKRFIVAGKALPFFFVGTTMMAQSIDANATMGNSGAVYGGGWWAGFQFPLGLALCLIITGLFYAAPLNRLNLITLPDFYYRRYSRVVEILVAIAMAISFMILVAGNLAGVSWIIHIAFGLGYLQALIGISVILFIYTMSGGMFSQVSTDIVMIYPSILGFVGGFFFMYFTYGWDFFKTAIPAGHFDLSGLTVIKSGALLNWAGILALGLGDVVALDFMERVFAAKSAKVAKQACYYAAGGTLIIGIAASFMGLMALKLSPNVAEPRMVLPTLALGLPFIFGLFIMGGIIGAGMSTGDGGVLAISSVFGRNIVQRNILKIWQAHYTPEDRKALDSRLLWVTRLAAIPVMAAAIWIAIVKPEPGILLVLAFDVVFAGCFVPLTLGLYWKKANSAGALAAVVIGSLLRVILYYKVPPELAGLDTLIPPVVSLLVMVPVSLLTQKSDPPKHQAVDYVPNEEELLSTAY